MQEFIISEATSIFLKAIKRYAKEQNVEENEISISLYLDEEAEVAYYLSINGKWHSDLSIKNILNVRKFSIKGYDVIIPPHIQSFLVDFRLELQSENIDVSVYINNENEDEVKFFLYNNGNVIREVFLKDLIKI
jgi:antitoxin component YwqK of YwqJK toxin-antitoxin module